MLEVVYEVRGILFARSSPAKAEGSEAAASHRLVANPVPPGRPPIVVAMSTSN